MKLSVLIPVYNQEDLVIKALDYLPRRDDMEVLVRDDGSTDNTLERLMEYDKKGLNLKVYANGENKGVSHTKNRLLEFASGEYFHIHDSDDHVYTERYSHIIDKLCDHDVVCMDLIVNSGDIWKVRPETERLYCAQIARFIRTEFAKGIEFPEGVQFGEDGQFNDELLERNPSTWFTEIPAYFYNYPRIGSLCHLHSQGAIQ